jgi:hypothetical protein
VSRSAPSTSCVHTGDTAWLCLSRRRFRITCHAGMHRSLG